MSHFLKWAWPKGDTRSCYQPLPWQLHTKMILPYAQRYVTQNTVVICDLTAICLTISGVYDSGSDVLTQLASMRKQLQSERRRVENALENSKVCYPRQLSSKTPSATCFFVERFNWNIHD